VRLAEGTEGTEGAEIGCPLTSTPPSEKWRLDTVVGRNGMEENSIVRICLAAPGCFR
jgi:hypothetical protein